jgi:hypothetical protein
VRWVAPDTPQGVALWLTHLGGSAEQTAPMLARLGERELLAASFDPPGHGRRRAGGEPWELASEVLGVFRRRMWPLAGRSVLESLRVPDWVDEHFGVAGLRVAGGVSTDGDVAVALAGVGPRIDCVAALVATPDWARPGMQTLGEDPVLLDQGEADRYAQWFFDALNPVRHLEAYERDVAIAFLCGAGRPSRARGGGRSLPHCALRPRSAHGRSGAGRAVRGSRLPRRGAGRAAVLLRARMAGAGQVGVRTEPPPKTDGTGSTMTSTARMRLPTTAT